MRKTNYYRYLKGFFPIKFTKYPQIKPIDKKYIFHLKRKIGMNCLFFGTFEYFFTFTKGFPLGICNS